MSYIKSNRTKTYTAGSTITKGYAVKLKDNEYVYPCDYTYIAPINSGTFGYSTSSKIENVAYVTATNQVLAVGKVNNLPHLYVGTVNTAAKTIAWNTPIQLSAVQVDPLSSIWIKYDDTLNRALISYAKVTTLVPHCITLTRTNSSYAIGTEADLTSGVASVSIKLTSDGTYFYLMSITSANQVKIHKVDATASAITTITTSASTGIIGTDVNGNFLQTSVSKILNAGTVSTNFLTLDNIKIWVVNNGNVSLSTVSGSINIDLSGIATFSTGGSTPSTASNISLTTTGIAAFGWVLSNAGNYAQIYLHDLTNGKAYKLFYQIGGSWNNNILEITRII